MPLVATRFKHTFTLRRMIQDCVRAGVDIDALVAAADASVAAGFNGRHFAYTVPAEFTYDDKAHTIYFEADELETRYVDDGSDAQLYDYD